MGEISLKIHLNRLKTKTKNIKWVEKEELKM